MRISDYIGETTEYDKKEMLEERKSKSWLKSISAFANGIGGALIFGVSDDDELVGLKDPKDVSEKISETIKTKMDPIPQIILEHYSENGREFIIVKVPAGQETPYYYIGDGNRIAYVRIGNESVPADATALKRLVLRGSGSTYDSLSSRYPLDRYAFTKLRSVYRQRTGLELEDSDFLSFGLVDEDGMLTNAGALLADESPMRFSRIFCTRWYGLSKASGVMEALDDKEISGSLITLLQGGEEFVRNNTKKRWKKTGNSRVEMPEYPERAVLECIVNGLIHRDYMILGSEVHIDIFDDRMEIYSPGGMMDGSLVQNLDTDNISSKRRNPVIADVFSRMNYMERRGSGFKKIKEDYHNAVNYRPELEPKFYSDISSNVPVEKVPVGPEKVAIGEENMLIEAQKLSIQKAINSLDAKKNIKANAMRLFNQMGIDGIFGRSDIMEVVGISITAAGNLITKLKDSGLIQAVSGYGKGKYKFTAPQ